MQSVLQSDNRSAEYTPSTQKLLEMENLHVHQMCVHNRTPQKVQSLPGTCCMYKGICEHLYWGRCLALPGTHSTDGFEPMRSLPMENDAQDLSPEFTNLHYMQLSLKDIQTRGCTC
jgi:hypothetical protein